jgi:hypothetical protein
VPRHRRTDRRLIAARERASRAVRLRTTGRTLREIAAALGYNSPQAVFYAIRSTLDRRESAAADEYRSLNLARLERMLLAEWQAALSGDDRAQKQSLRIIHEMNAVVGVHRPEKSGRFRVALNEDQHQAVGVGIRWVPDADWLRLFAEAYEEVHSSEAEGRP